MKMPTADGIYYFVSDLRQTPQSAPIPMVLVHGAGGNHLYWPAHVRRLPDLRVLAVDLPAHGQSSGIAEQEISAYARRLAEWAKSIGIERAIWVGHSMGGAIALTLALEYPKMTAALGLVATAARLPVSPYLLDATAHEATMPSAVEAIMKWAFSPQTPENLRTQAAKRMSEVRYSVLHNDFVACNLFDVSDRLGEIEAPALVLHGSADKMVPLREGEFLANNIPNAELRVFPNAGHMLMLEKPREVSEVLREFGVRVQRENR